MYERTISLIRREPTTHPSIPATDLEQWLVDQAAQHRLRWLLLHDDEGVSWGEVRTQSASSGIRRLLHLFARKVPTSQLHLSGHAVAPHSVGLNRASLRQCRLFGPTGELLIWRGPQVGKTPPDRTETLQARLFRDDKPTDPAQANGACIDEDHWLWGWGDDRDTHDGFIRLTEGTQGITHAPPLRSAPTATDRAKLRVRHYLATDERTGMVQMVESRLMQVVEPTTPGANTHGA